MVKYLLNKIKQIIHMFHNEEKANWKFLKIEEDSEVFTAYWEVKCSCGVTLVRKRIYIKPDEVSKEFYEVCDKSGSLQRYIDEGTYHTFFGHTVESATAEAKAYKGDNYSI